MLLDLIVEFLLGNQQVISYLINKYTSDDYIIILFCLIIIGYVFFQFNFTISIDDENITGMTTAFIRRKYCMSDLTVHKNNRYYLILKRRNSDWFKLYVPKFLENYDDCYKFMSKYIDLDDRR